MKELHLEKEPDNTDHLYFKDGDQTFDLTYLQSILLSSVAGRPRSRIYEAAIAHRIPEKLISKLLSIGAYIQW